MTENSFMKKNGKPDRDGTIKEIIEESLSKLKKETHLQFERTLQVYMKSEMEENLYYKEKSLHVS